MHGAAAADKLRKDLSYILLIHVATNYDIEAANVHFSSKDKTNNNRDTVYASKRRAQACA